MEKDFGSVYIRENGNRLKVTLNDFRGKHYLHIRDYGFDGDTGKLYPLPKGITIDPNEVDVLIEVLQEVSKFVTASMNLNQLEFDF
jgi:hypothetical protein